MEREGQMGGLTCAGDIVRLHPQKEKERAGGEKKEGANVRGKKKPNL